MKVEESRPMRRKDELALNARMKRVAQKRRRVSSRLVGGEIQSFMVRVHTIWTQEKKGQTWEGGAGAERFFPLEGTSERA
jgi:hypothetical protein